MRRVALVIAALSIAATARAADFFQPPGVGVTQGPPVAMGGWYLRGDIGYSAPARPNAHGLLPAGLVRDFDDARFGKGMTAGVGVGLRINNWLRADATAEWRGRHKFSATNSASNYVDGYSDERAKFSARTFLLNGYIDLGNWSGLTPYIGAGAGVTVNETKGWTTQVVCFTALCAPSGPTATLPDSSKSGFAWALMAGTAIDVAPNIAIDLGYRFINLGGITTKVDPFGVAAKIADAKAHEVRLGLRYMFR